MLRKSWGKGECMGWGLVPVTHAEPTEMLLKTSAGLRTQNEINYTILLVCKIIFAAP
jgi:hypothetical protein